MPPADTLIAAAEALDQRILRDYVHTQRRVWPDGGAALCATAAGLAAFDGTGRDSRLAGIKCADGLDALVEWHARTRATAAHPAPGHAACRLVLAPDAPADLPALLVERGFVYRSHALVMWRALGDPLPAVDPALPVTLAGPEQRALAVHTIARGYLDGGAPGPLDLRAGETWFDLPDCAHLLVGPRGRPLGGGAVVVRGPHALLGQMSVLPAGRGRGVQRAALAHRLRHARARGATHAFATCAPQGPSLRNLRRAGFAISHARISLVHRSSPNR